jgi:hypothetical protein
MALHLVTVVADEINRPRLPVESGGVLVSKAEFDGDLQHWLYFICRKISDNAISPSRLWKIRGVS